MEDVVLTVATILRKKAEKLLKSRDKKNNSLPSSVETLCLIHELEVQQIELEMQKNELEMKNLELYEKNVLFDIASENTPTAYESVPSGYFTLNREGEIVEINYSALLKLDLDRSQLLHLNFSTFVSPECLPEYHLFLDKVFKDKLRTSCDIVLSTKKQKVIHVHLTGLFNEFNYLCYISVRDLTQSKRLELFREMTREILQILNEPESIKETLHRTLNVLKKRTNVDAVGIRMQFEADYPYFDQTGFTDEFLQTEQSLIDIDKDGNISMDESGSPCLACTCGLVISGKANPCNPYVTPGGSWWTNNSFPILDMPSWTDERYLPRNRCIHQGYASIALIPVRNGATIVGLLQFNDRYKDQFNRPIIEVLEGIALHIGAAIQRKYAKEILRKSEELLRTIIDNAPDIIVQVDAAGTILYMNRTLAGFTLEEIIGVNFCEFTLPEYHAVMKQTLKRVFDESITQTFLSGGKDGTGEMHWYRTGISPIKEGGIVKKAVMVARDITENILNEKTLRESEEKRNAIMVTAMDGFSLADMYGHYLEVNDMYCRMTGYSEEELLTMRIHDLEDIETLQETDAHIQKIIALREDRFETRHRCKDGSVIDVEVNVQFKPINGGQFLTFIRDISKRKRSEENLRLSEERYKSLFQDNQSVMLLLNPDTGEIIDANPAACSYYGWSHSELCHKNITEIDPIPKAETARKLQESKQEKNNHLFLKHWMANGELRDVEVFSGPIRFNDSIMLYSIIHDVTDRNRAQEALRVNEERYSLIYNSSRDGIFSLDRSGIITGANRSFCKEIKQDLSRILGHTFEEIGLPEYVCLELEHLKKHVLETNKSILSEIEVLPSNGNMLYYEVIVNPMHDEKKNIVGFGASIRNITKRKESNQALIESERRFRYLVKDMPVGVILYGPDSEIMMSNPKALELLGVINEDHLKVKSAMSEGWIAIHEDGSPFPKKDQPLRQTFATCQSVHDVVIGIYRQSTFDLMWLLMNAEVVLKDNGSIRNVVCSFIDITRQKEIVNNLRENEQRLKYHFENSPLAVVEWDNHFVITEWSLEAEHIFGWKKDEVLGMKIDALNLTYDEDIPFVYHTLERLTSGEEDTLVNSTRIVTKSGNLIDCVWYNSILLDQKGRMSSVLSLVQDVTLRKQAENKLKQLNEELEDRVKERTAELIRANEALKLTQEKYRTVADFATNWEFWTDPLDHMLYCSPSCEEITGYNSTEFDQNPRLLFDIIHPEDLPIYREHKNNELLTHVYDQEIQYRIYRKDGAIRWLGHFCRPVYDENGNFKGVRGSNKDITSRKKMEELITTSNQKYKLLSENITDGIFICKNGRFEYVNNAIYEIFEYKGRELEGMKLTQLVSTDYHEELETFLYTNSSNDRSSNLEVECLKKDSSTVFVEILLNFISKDKMIYGVIHDITEKKLLQKSIVKAIIQTEERERSHFSKELHDGLGPLLSTIKLYLQWSERPNSNKSRKEIMEKAGEILEEALVTVKEVSNKLSPHLLINYGLNSAIKSFVEKLNATAAYDIIFESNTTRRIDSEIEAALYRAVIECINNTLKYAHANNIYIHLNDTGTQIQLQYKDDGEGFDVLEAFSKNKGLGLFNLQNRLQTIGGKVELHSEPGKGVNYLFTVDI